MTRSRSLAAVVLVVLLGVVLPIGIVVRSASVAFAGKEFGLPGTELNEIASSLKNGELWFSVGRWTQTKPRRLIGCDIKRLNLETGVLSDSQIEPAKAFLQPFWLGDKLYAFGQNTLYECVESKFEELVLLPPRIPPYFFTRPFLHDRKISTIINPSDNVFRMVHLVDGEWIDGPLVQLPNLPEKRTVDSEISFGIQPARQQLPDTTEASDDIAKESVAAGTPIQPALIDDRTQYELTFGPEGAYYVSIRFPILVARQQADGSWKKLEGDYGRRNHHGHHPIIVADPSQSSVYLIEPHPWGVYADIHRVEGDTVLPSHVHWSGGMRDYLQRWYQLSVGLLVAWLIHLVVLIAGVQWFARDHQKSHLASGILQAINASVWRRALAVVIDLLIALAIPTLLLLVQLPYFGVQRLSMNDGLLFDILYDVERAIADGIERGPGLRALLRIVGGVLEIIPTFVEAVFDPPVPKNPAFFLLIIAELAFLVLLKVFIEGRSGMTIGKWCLGIRTVRSTLPPCGFARALMRNVLYWVDLPFLLTPFPAAMSMIFSQQNQRLADRVADTIVVRAGSIRLAADEREQPGEQRSTAR